MNSVPTLGLIAVAKKNHPKEETYQFVEYYKKKLDAEKGIKSIIEPTVLFDEAEIAARAHKMETDGVDVLVVVVGTWIYSSIVIAAVNDLHVPVILFGLSDRIACGNLGASIQIRYVLQEMGRKPIYMAGTAMDEKNFDIILKYLKAGWIKNYLRNRKIATIGGKCMMMYQTQVNEFNWKRVFGVDFPQYDASHVFMEMEKVDEKEAKALADEFLGKVDKVNWKLDTGEEIKKDAILSQAKMALAFKRLQKLYGIDIFANKCMPDMMHIDYGYGYGACIATAMLNDSGVTTACEADVPAGLSMYILSLLSGQRAVFADIARLNKKEKKITFFNCGSAPLSMADKKKKITVWPIPGNIPDEAVPDEYYIGKVYGACVKLELESGKEATLLRIGGNDDTLRFHVAKAITAPPEVDPDNVTGNRWPGFAITLKGDMQKFLENTVGHHYSLVYGDYVEELRCLAELYGIRFVYDA